MATFLLTASQKTDDGDRMASADGLGSAVLAHNVRWFIKVRWIAVAILVLAGLVSNFAPAILTGLGLIPPHRWPWILALSLAVANLVFRMLSRHLTEKSSDKTVKGNLWLQIAADLAAVTILVHCVGSTHTFISFIYLFHIMLACIFFSPARSLLVTLTAAGLYLLCVSLELLEIWPAAGMVPLYASHVADKKIAVISAVSAVLVWLVVWYLVAALAKIVRERGRLLEIANQRLLAADQEKNRIMLRTTHDLKAPFSGIESNIQVLKLQYWDQIPDSVKDIVQRIEARAQTLSDRIKDILLLGDLRTRMEPAAAPETMDLGQVLQEVAEELEDKARARRIVIRLQPTKPLRVAGAARHFSILFSNLIANAISYSPEGRIVKISVYLDNKDVHVLVRDAGIGIAEKSLPHIFDEYFRTKEAARFNPGSTGLGLAIVKEIVQKEGLKISVTSEVGKGTTFDVAIPVRGM